MLLRNTLALLLPSTLAAYTIVDDYTQGNFASKFDFFTANDPTNGYVNYVDYATAQASGLYSASADQVYIGVDHNNTASGRGRNSIRISSKKSYQHGLIILDLAHMPAGACGTWPAFWLLSVSDEWPNGGEIDIIEGVNSQSYNTMAAHTNSGCSISNNGSMSGQILTSNCDVKAPNQASNQGCSIKSTTPNTFGDGFNANGGGVYATEWTSNGFSVWFFPRNAIPSDITNGNPNPVNWGLPISRFAGACDWDKKVVNQQILFDVTFCGDWAGNAFSSDDTCKSKASTCQAYVQNNPAAFVNTYWSINSLKVFQQNGQATPTVSSSFTATATSSSSVNSALKPSSSTSSSSTYFTSTYASIQTLTTSFLTLTTTTTPVSASSTSAITTLTSSTTSSQLSSSTSLTTLTTTTVSSTSTTSTIASTSTTTSYTAPLSSLRSTSLPTSATSTWTSTQTASATTTLVSTSSTSSVSSSQWQYWPNTFYTITRPGGWDGSNSGPGNWGGRPGWSRPTGT